MTEWQPKSQIPVGQINEQMMITGVYLTLLKPIRALLSSLFYKRSDIPEADVITGR